MVLLNVVTCASEETQKVLFSISLIKLMLIAKKKLGYVKRLLKSSLLYPGLRLIRYIMKSTIFRSITKFQRSYCFLVWMFYSRTSNNVINMLHEQALRITLDNKIDSCVPRYEEPPWEYLDCNYRTIKVLNDLSPQIMDNFLTMKGNHYNNRKREDNPL